MNAARVVVLVLAIGAGGVAALLAGRGDPPPPAPAPAPVAKLETVDVLVAKGDIGIGHSLGGQDLQWQAWPASAMNQQYIRRSDNPNALTSLAGSITRAPFGSGEPIREAKLIRANGSGYMAAIVQQGLRAIAIDISPESGVAGFILPNDRVDVLLTRAEKINNQDVFSSEVILADVRVLAIDQTVEEKNGQKSVVGKIATVELAPRRAETLVLARRLGTISLALRGLTESGTKASDIESDRLGVTERLNVVRFGVKTAIAPK